MKRTIRSGLLIAVWSLVLARVLFELTGRGAAYVHDDLQQLFADQQKFYAGTYPSIDSPHAAGGRAAQPDAWRSVYPPHSFALLVPLLPPGLGWGAARMWFAAAQLLALMAVIAWVCALVPRREPGLRWLLIGSILAMTGLRADLLFGNLALVMLATLVLLERMLQSGRGWAAAAAWAASMAKPQMGWLFAPLFFRRGGWRPLAFAGLLLALAAAVTLAWTGTSPVTLVTAGYSEKLADTAGAAVRANLIALLSRFGASPAVTLPLAAGIGTLVVCAVLRGRLGAASVLAQMAFAGVINRLCTYHSTCDDLLLVFAVVVLGRRAWRAGRGREVAAFLAFDASIWAPTALLDPVPARIAVVLIWTTAAVLLAAPERAEPDAAPAARA